MVRVRPIGRPQLGHKCAELSVFPPVIVHILTSKTHRAVMAVTVERDFLRGRRPVYLAVLALNVLGRPLDQFFRLEAPHKPCVTSARMASVSR